MSPMSSGARKHILTAHILYSVGWVGAVAAFLGLAIAGYTTADGQLVAGIYASLRVLIWFVIAPLSLLSLASGIIQSLGTPWGLFRHYWVIAKLVLTAGATILLFVHTQVVDRAAGDALAHPGMIGGGMSQVRLQLVVDSAAALVVLILITILGTVKPRGTTPRANARTSDSIALPAQVRS